MKLAVVCDFDETAAEQNVAALLLERFGGAEVDDARDRHRSGSLTFREYQEIAFRSTTADIAEMAEYAAGNASLRPRLAESVQAAREAGAHFQIVSAGLDFYISAVLARHGLDGLPYVAVRAGPASARGSEIRYDYPEGQSGCAGDWAVCKCRVVEATRSSGARVAFVGDGLRADACASGRADFVFARGRLLDYCQRSGVQATPFEDFSPVADFIVEMTSVTRTGTRTGWRAGGRR